MWRASSLLGLGLAVLIAAPASATFPGSNGSIAFTHCEGPGTDCSHQHIYAVDPGGAPVQLTNDAKVDVDPAYSSDGRRIAFGRGIFNSSPCVADIVVMDANGANQTDLTSATSNCDDYPSFSPDGAHIVFNRKDGTVRHIYVMDGNGANQHQLTNTADGDTNAVYSPDGSKIAFARSPSSGSPRIWVMNADGSGQAAVSTPGSGERDASPDWAPDGASIAFSRLESGAGKRRIWMMAANGDNQHRVADPGSTLADAEPAFSPEGTQLAFERDDASFIGPIEVAGTDGSAPHAVTGGTTFDYRPAWQPAAPVFTSQAGIVGSAVNGHTLTATPAAARGGGATTLQWLACDKLGNTCAPIAGATGQAYVLRSADIGRTVRLRQTQTNRPGATSTDSAPTAVVAPNPARCSNVFRGTRRADRFRGTTGGDLFNGLGGNDVLRGGAGADCLSGGSGKDKLSGGPGNDRLSGGAGKDVISAGSGRNTVSGGAGDDKINVRNGRKDVVSCGAGSDSVRADRVDKLRACEHVSLR
ncbi:MAG: TolB protein [Thermoleophilaceae bacterium]|nr:TolB protein [Thermoleophilaceae bacterium]